MRTDKQKRSKQNRVAFSSTSVQISAKATLISTTINTPFPRALTLLRTLTLFLEKHKSSNKDIADLSIVKCYNYNKFSHYTTSCTMPRTKRTRAELARVEQGLESRDSEFSISDSENKEL